MIKATDTFDRDGFVLLKNGIPQVISSGSVLVFE